MCLSERFCESKCVSNWCGVQAYRLAISGFCGQVIWKLCFYWLGCGVHPRVSQGLSAHLMLYVQWFGSVLLLLITSGNFRALLHGCLDALPDEVS